MRMQRKTVISTDIHSIGYEVLTQTLEIEFNSGGIYQYKGVSTSTYKSLMEAASHGKFFHAFIKDRYPTVKIR
jgi:hypothetical protein